MVTRQPIAAHFDAPENNRKTSKNSTATAYKSRTYAKSGTHPEDPGFLGLSLPRNQRNQKETTELNNFDPPTQEATHDSYSAKNSIFSGLSTMEMTEAPWKKAFWEAVVDEMDGLVTQGMFYMLRDNAWLDRVEGKFVFVAADSEFCSRILAREATKPLTLVISYLLGKEIQLRVIQGSPRIFEKNTPVPPADSSTAGWEAEQLAKLHREHGDIMGIVDGHPLFLKAQTPLEKGGWGIFPQVLTLRCKEYGVMAVLKALRFANRPSVINKRGFFLHTLKKGQFGYPLAEPAPNMGRVGQ